jgi:hypothetical protein
LKGIQITEVPTNITITFLKEGHSCRQLFKVCGILASRLTVKWYGESQPKVENSSPENMAENRRVEFAITANDKMKEQAAKEAANKN